MGIFDALGLPSVSDVWSANQARDNATTAYNRQRELTQWQGSNAVQWRVSDLKAAGINPILAAGMGLGGGGGVASVASAGTPPSSGYGSSQAASSAKQAQTQQTLATSQVDLNSATAEAQRAAAELSRKNAANVGVNTGTPEQANQGREASIAKDTGAAHSSEAAATASTAMLGQISATVANLGVELAKGNVNLTVLKQMQDLELKIQQQKLTQAEQQTVMDKLKAQLAIKVGPTVSEAADRIHDAGSFLNPANWLKQGQNILTIIRGAIGDAGDILSKPNQPGAKQIDKERLNFGKYK